jgi:hypothetical protein
MTDHDKLPRVTRRLFSNYANSDRLAAESPEFVIGRVLEEGVSDDLRWLFARFSNTQIEEWLERRGSRQLSRRSRLFWGLILKHPVAEPPDINQLLWPF